MCRLFALRANQPTRVEPSLLSARHSLYQQSCGDRCGLCHNSGWGIGYYAGDQLRRVRSALTPQQDPAYRRLATALVAPTVLGHVRLASAGAVAERNSHPFVHGRWLFAHNGTLRGFADDPERLRRLIPAPLLSSLEGDTDSEHAFHLLLARLERAGGTQDRPVPMAEVARAVSDTVHTLADLFPPLAGEQSEFNFVLTDGRLLVATRWGHTLFWLQRRGPVPPEADAPAEASPDYQAVAVASEPTTTEDWAEIPERTLMTIDADLKTTRVAF